jgi:hypothetical protein
MTARKAWDLFATVVELAALAAGVLVLLKAASCRL